MRRARLGAAALAAALAACLPAPHAGPGAAGSHAIEGAQLRATMRQLDRLRHGRMPQELDLERDRVLHRAEAVRLAEAIAAQAGSIRGLAPLGTLSPEDRARFEALAGTLRSQAAALAADADRLSAQDFDARFTELDATCDACHRQFRPPSGGGP
jgi:cytochrome c556